MYDCLFLNKNLETEYRCRVIDFLWDSKLYDVGEFQIQILDDGYLDLSKCKYLQVYGKDEFGLIQRWEYDSTAKNTILISGFFGERLLFDSVLYPTYQTTSSKPAWQVIKEVCQSYILDFPLTISSYPSSSSGATASVAAFQRTGEYIGTLAYEICQPHGYGVNVRLASAMNGVDINLKNCIDRTGQGSADQVALSVSWNNIKSYDIAVDNSNYKNVAIVAGQGEGSARIVETVDQSASGEVKSYLWVDANDIGQEEGMSLSAYRSLLAERGKEKLAENTKINSVEVQLTQTEADRIGIDYGLGDIVMVAITPLNLLYSMQIVEIEDIYNQGKRSTTVALDNLGSCGWQKVRNLYR